MTNFFVVGDSGGIGSALIDCLPREAQIFSASRTATGAERCVAWDAAATDLPAGFLPDELAGMAYCPGTIRLAPFDRLKDDAFSADFSTNLLGAVRAIRAALPALKASGRGSIVLFSTVAVATGMPMHASIAAAKGAVEGLTRALAAELAPQVRVNAVAPSLSDTPLAAGLLKTERQRRAAAARHPLERIGHARDPAAAAAFLLSPAASWITGQVLAVDGGIGALRRFG